LKDNADGNGTVESTDTTDVSQYILMGTYSPLVDVNKGNTDIMEMINILRQQANLATPAT
jgi:hypothetical protein